jgi:hypothetical protein
VACHKARPCWRLFHKSPNRQRAPGNPPPLLFQCGIALASVSGLVIGVPPELAISDLGATPGAISASLGSEPFGVSPNRPLGALAGLVSVGSLVGLVRVGLTFPPLHALPCPNADDTAKTTSPTAIIARILSPLFGIRRTQLYADSKCGDTPDWPYPTTLPPPVRGATRHDQISFFLNLFRSFVFHMPPLGATSLA